ncbi:putative outer-membrane lipoprotein carrier protein LolA [Advenella mimigardefordensis DPN7]|uniref:Putative outer-membrane lipoprotein carrier protein LolA n=2 Tax=Advenella mimigardefordensis TaxID=302406 RepID=W0PGA4_ADVMD|nr:putative outer-membrane lipoprotein carrier protein LolA [Advenella mimigardefordensis DPN7]
MPAIKSLFFLSRLTFLLVLTLLCHAAQAFSLQDLQQQLAAHQTVQGDVQQKRFLRSLEQPLLSQGSFVMAADKGLLWETRSPIASVIRITPKGMMHQDSAGQWQPLQQQGAGSQTQIRLFMDLLSGNTRSLSGQFTQTLQGDAQDWTLTLDPTSSVLKQIFQRITIRGARSIEQVTLAETQGDRTEILFSNVRINQPLPADAQHALEP